MNKIRFFPIFLSCFALLSSAHGADKWLPESGFPLASIAFWNCDGATCTATGHVQADHGNKFFPYEVEMRPANGAWEGHGVIKMKYGNTEANIVWLQCDYPIWLRVDPVDPGKVAVATVRLARAIPIAQSRCMRDPIFTELRQTWGPMRFRPYPLD